MTSILALDLSTNVGFAFWSAAYGIKSGHWRIAPPATPIGRFLQLYDAQLSERLAFFEPTIVVFEAPFVGTKTSQDVARKLMGLACITEYLCLKEGLEESNIYEVNNASVRRHFCGKGKGARAEMKDRVMKPCRDRGWEPANDDEADSLAVLDYAVHCLRLPNGVPEAFSRLSLQG